MHYIYRREKVWSYLFASTETVEFGEHFSQVLRMFAAEIRLLELSSSTPRAPLAIRPVHDGVLW
jgi:hypothetical protein